MEIQPADIPVLLADLEMARSNWLNWVSFDLAPDAQYANTEMRFFQSAHDAETYCEPSYFPSLNMYGEEIPQVYHGYMPLEALRKRILSAEDKQPVSAESVRLARSAMEAGGIRPYLGYSQNEEQYMARFSSGEISPVLWQKQVIPQDEIEFYHVIDHRFPKGQIYEVGHEVQILNTFSNYHEAYKHLLETINHPVQSGDNYLLAGQYRGKEFHLDIEGHPSKASGIVLVSAVEQREDHCYHLVFPNDRSKATTIEQVLFGSYNAHSNELNLYDDMLKKALPGTVDYNIYANHFESGELITIQKIMDMEQKKEQTPLEKLQESVMYAGFGTELNKALAEKVTEGLKEFSLSYALNEIAYNLHFKKDENKEAYYFNKYDAILLQTEKVPIEIKQTFYHNQNITAKEAYNLLSGGSVFKTFNVYEKVGEGEDAKYKWTPETYEAWAKLNFDKQDKQGNYELKKYGEGYGFDFNEKLKEYPIVELENPEKASKMIRALKKGDLTPATVMIDGKPKEMLVRVDAKYKKLNIYYKNGTPMFQQNKVKVGKEQSQQTSQGQKAGTSQTVKDQVAAKKSNRRQQGHKVKH